ncbi:MAG TPA: polysaccharide deacetylase family protein [Micromonosporaceae bacterium]|nr:polysaccharide deacetylase family protein [Micromonosporaceae bacterium]
MTATRLQPIRDAVSGYRVAQAAYRSVLMRRTAAERWALALRGRSSRDATAHGRVLAYHSIGTPHWGINDVSPRDFERHLQIAVDDGWSFATPAEVLAAPDKRLLALTFDDGVTSVLTHALPVLRHHGIPATAFIVTGWADGEHPAGHEYVLDWPGVRALRDGGVTIASHSVTHADFGRLTAAEARRELEVSKDRLHRMLDLDTDEFAIPLGQLRNWTDAARSAAVDAGYRTVYAQAINTRPAGTVARTFITRIDRPTVFRAALAGAYDDWEE